MNHSVSLGLFYRIALFLILKFLRFEYIITLYTDTLWQIISWFPASKNENKAAYP